MKDDRSMLLLFKNNLHLAKIVFTFYRLTSISNQQWHEKRLFLGEDFDEFLEISDTSASKKLEQLIVAVTWLYHVDNVFFLRPRDTSHTTKLSDKRIVGVNTIQQLNTIDSQRAHPSFV